jgi:hypothetical protein
MIMSRKNQSLGHRLEKIQKAYRDEQHHGQRIRQIILYFIHV